MKHKKFIWPTKAQIEKQKRECAINCPLDHEATVTQRIIDGILVVIAESMSRISSHSRLTRTYFRKKVFKCDKITMNKLVNGHYDKVSLKQVLGYAAKLERLEKKYINYEYAAYMSDLNEKTKKLFPKIKLAPSSGVGFSIDLWGDLNDLTITHPIARFRTKKEAVQFAKRNIGNIFKLARFAMLGNCKGRIKQGTGIVFKAEFDDNTEVSYTLYGNVFEPLYRHYVSGGYKGKAKKFALQVERQTKNKWS